jgi:RHS repeat-associated protein
VAKGTISAWSCDPSVNGFQTTNDYVLGPSGEQVTEMAMDGNNTMAWQHTNVYAAGKLLATYDNNGLHFYLNDPLGTRRARTDYAGVLEQTCSGLPFGDGLSCTNSTEYPTERHFTGKECDTESGLDYFGARYYGSTMGRWMSPDPSNWGVDFSNPQTWNHYSYAGNNPLSKTDPNGLWLTPTHNSIIDHALPGLSNEQRQILKDQSKQVDTDQSQEGSYKHGMSSEDNDPYSSTGAYNPTYQTNDFIEQNEHDAKETQADWIASGHTGIAPAALAAFGNAAHAIADEYSPAHTGFQKVNHWTIAWHILRETTFFGLHKQQQQQAAGAIQNAFFNTFGTDLGNQATHEKVTVTIIFDPNQKPLDQQQ